MEITQITSEIHHEFVSEYARLYSSRNLEMLLGILFSEQGTPQYYQDLLELEDMLQSWRIPFLRDQPLSYYKKLVEESTLPDMEDLEDKILLSLVEHFNQFPAPQDFIKRVVDLQEKPANNWRNLPLRLRILKTFVKDCGSLQGTGVGGCKFIKQWARDKTGRDKLTSKETAEVLTDDIFDVLKDLPEEKAGLQDCYGILEAADDLARGAFRVSGGAKRIFYLFAIAYRMTFSGGQEDAAGSDPTDVATLMGDWYNNNLKRFLDPYAQIDHAGGLEIDPGGYGINYGNWVEMVYMYCIQKPNKRRNKEGMTPREKLRMASRLISQVQDAVEEIQKVTGADLVTLREAREVLGDEKPEIPRSPFLEEISTSFYVGNAAPAVMKLNGKEASNVFQLKEDDFVRYLLLNYECDAGKRNPFLLRSFHRSAVQCYHEALDRLDSILKNGGGKRNDQDNVCNYGLWYACPVSSSALETKKAYEEKLYERLKHRASREQVHQLCILLKRMNDIIGYAPSERPMDGKNDRDKTRFGVPAALRCSDSKVTRSSLLAVYYYIYTQENKDSHWAVSFEKVYNEMEAMTREPLLRSGYMPLSKKSLFDQMLVFSAFDFLF